MDEINSATPIKLRMKGDELGVATPSGGLIFNPFHKEFISRVGQVTFSPGIFSYTASPMDNKNDSCRNTPNRFSLPFVLSPETQGLLFPADIDENPILQLKLQEKLDTQCDEDVQNSIHSFFKSHLIAPSPDTVDGSDSKSNRCQLPRTSSMVPTATPKTRKKSMCPAPLTILCARSVSSQTTLTIPPNYDFEALLKQAMSRVGPYSPTDLSGRDFYGLNAEVDSNLPRFIIPTREKSIQLDPSELDATQGPDCAHEIGQAVAPTECNSFLCSSCRKPHHPQPLTRRSLFSESSETIDDTVNNRLDEDFTTQQTLMFGDAREHRRALHHSVKLFSSDESNLPPAETLANHGEPVKCNGTTSSLADGAADLHLTRRTDQLKSVFSNEDVFAAHSDLSGSEELLSPIVRVTDARASSPSPICGRYHRHGSPFRCDSVEMASINVSCGELSFPHMRDAASPQSTHAMSFMSPNLSPILPTSFVRRPSSPVPPDANHSYDSDGKQMPEFCRLPTPAARLFASPDRPVSPVPLVFASNRSLNV
ncbi:hypothetical protein D915_001742 [Fasciola hepatica]|uniref:Protein aurora borealis n=1 Tax=Fasciola hepatica TaxID=6192 RepID=A0A4E0S3H5_FASHE|nr:hypothetical protein D915_001742 [Fasciola hepatica]